MQKVAPGCPVMRANAGLRPQSRPCARSWTHIGRAGNVLHGSVWGYSANGLDCVRCSRMRPSPSPLPRPRLSLSAMGNVSITQATLLEFRHVPSVAALTSPNASQCVGGGATVIVAVQVRCRNDGL